MVTFDQNGNLTPYSLISLALTDIETYFVISFPEFSSRTVLYWSFKTYISALTEVLKRFPRQWLGGSFISNKLNPNDVDCVNLIEFDENVERNIGALLLYLLIGGSRDSYQVDGHLIAVYPVTDERYELITLPSIAYWQTFFMKDRQDNPRGFIEVTNPI